MVSYTFASWDYICTMGRAGGDLSDGTEEAQEAARPRRSPGAILRMGKKEFDRNEIKPASLPDSPLSLQSRGRSSESILLGEKEAQ